MSQDERHDGRLVSTPDGEMIKKNPRASQAAQRGAAARYSPDPIQAVKKASGANPRVTVNPNMPVSRTNGMNVELAPDAGPAEAAHEGEHVRAALKGTRGPAEGPKAKEKYVRYGYS